MKSTAFISIYSVWQDGRVLAIVVVAVVQTKFSFYLSNRFIFELHSFNLFTSARWGSESGGGGGSSANKV